MEHWIRTGRRTLVNDRWMRLHADDCRLPNGHTLTPYYVMEESEWVHVVAVDAQGRVLVTWQYRYAAGVFCAELPGGTADASEPPLSAAKRELKEETGFEAADWTLLGVMHANPARQTNRIHSYLARGLSGGGEQSLDISEEIAFGFRSTGEIKRMIHTGEFGQAMHIATFLLAADHLSGA